jgi:hypothetical protein
MSTPSYKSSTIFIGVRDKTAVYRSVDEVPEEFRDKLAEATTRPDCATILIADQRGKEEISRALRGEVSSVRLRFVESVQLQLEKALAPPLKFTWLRWVRWLLPIAAAVICWLAFR